MKIEDIAKVLIVVEFKNGNAHQVLSTKEHKELTLRFIAGLDDGLKLSNEIEPFNLVVKDKYQFMFIPHN